MNNVTSRSFLPAVALLIAASLIPRPALAACTAPAAVAGTLEYFSAQNIFKYCDGTNWIGWGDGGSASSLALSVVTAATGANSINNGTNGQTWNWALTGATADAFTFTENTAATGGSGDQSILKAAAIASSTALPLMVTNLGNGISFRVNDETGDTDTTPFVIDASGNVGIGDATPDYVLDLEKNNPTNGWMLQLENTDTAASTTGAWIKFDQNGSGGHEDWGAGVHAYGWSIYNSTDTAYRLTVDNTGNVGIGTTGPQARLHIEGSTTGPVTFDTDAAISATNPAWSARAVDNLGAGTGGYSIQSTTDYAAYVDRLSIMYNGNVGIGTATPGSKLHIKDTGGAGTYRDLATIEANGEPWLTLSGADADQWYNPTLSAKRARGSLSAPAAVQDDDELFCIQSIGYDGTGYTDALGLCSYVDGAVSAGNIPARWGWWTIPGLSQPNMILDSAGKLTIWGTNADTIKPLMSLQTTGEGALNISNASDFDYYNPIIFTSRARGTIGARTAVASADSAFEILVHGYDGTTDLPLAYIQALVDGTPGTNDMPGRIEFHTQADGAGGSLEGTTPEMVIKNNGNVGIGTSSPQSTLHVPDGKYAQFEDNNAGAPPAGDCDNNAERGRMSIDTTNNRLYVCNGATRGWDYLTLTN